MRLPRFRLRTLMVLVAVAAVPMTAATMLDRRAARFRELARFHRREARAFGVSDLDWFLLVTVPQGASTTWWQELYDSEADYALVISAARYTAREYDVSYRYEEAAKRPWAAPVADEYPVPRPPVAETRTVLAKALIRVRP